MQSFFFPLVFEAVLFYISFSFAFSGTSRLSTSILSHYNNCKEYTVSSGNSSFEGKNKFYREASLQLLCFRTIQLCQISRMMGV